MIRSIFLGLKKVTDDMKTHKNPGLRLGPAPYQKPATAPKPASPKTAPKPAAAAKPPKFGLEGKKWLVVSLPCRTFTRMLSMCKGSGAIFIKQQI
jgi:hypothetical protein